MIVGWEDGEVVEVNLGPGDMILNARDIGHGFRVDGVEPVLMSISVDVGKPQPPRYHCHEDYPGNSREDSEQGQQDHPVRPTQRPSATFDGGLRRQETRTAGYLG